ncbi:pyridoxal-phosphate dependent enzyme domain-containing protein [Ditylenchus destructor]|uniref:Pyridoxal-phosphate dependent enzyme domain-containing protein n=1 Tax=Ditylenchus destructor TaxID=166010 RepID=A0AAD4NFB7_9BILA|nr:pyridoxal-phosphate dependent enzyme domain-containing protein [Ditylenchus destructor]
MSRINYLLTVSFLRYIILLPTIADKLTEVPIDEDRVSDSGFLRKALDILWYERDQMGHTPLFKVNVPGATNLELFFKNEATSRTGNLKHRFSWALFLWALLEGHITRYTTIYEASSGNTATSEAYFAQKIGVSFVAVAPPTFQNSANQPISLDCTRKRSQAALSSAIKAKPP